MHTGHAAACPLLSQKCFAPLVWMVLIKWHFLTKHFLTRLWQLFSAATSVECFQVILLSKHKTIKCKCKHNSSLTVKA